MNSKELSVQGHLRLTFGATTLAPLVSLFLLALIASMQPTGNTTLLVLALIACSTAILSVTGYLYRRLNRQLTARMLNLIDTCRNYAGGDRTARVNVSGDDAFALLAQTLNTLLDSQEYDEAEEDIRRRETYRLSAVQGQVEQLLLEVRALTHPTAAPPFKPSQRLEQLSTSFAHLIEEVSQAILHLHLGTAHICKEAALIQASSTDLTNEAREEMTHLTHLTNSLEQLAAFYQQATHQLSFGATQIDTIGEQAQRSQQALHSVLLHMTHARQVTGEAAITTSALHAEAHEFTQAFLRFGDVLHQVSLLAQNAHLQGTLPFGETEGKQAALFAQDLLRLEERMKALGEQFQTSLERVQQTTTRAVEALQNGQDTVSEGLHLVEEAGEALSTLALETGRTSHLIHQLNREAERQTSHLALLTQAQRRVTTQMEQTDASRQGIAERLETLAHLSESLRRFVDTLNVSDTLAASDPHPSHPV